MQSLLTSTLDPLFAWLAKGWNMATETNPRTEEVTGESTLEAGWMRRIAGGDESAWQLLFDRWKLPLLSYFYRTLGSRAEAEDLTLEVFVRLHRAADSYEPKARFSTYLFQIARNLALNEVRRRGRKPADAVPPEAFDYVAEGRTEEARGLAELEEVLQHALSRLPEKYRTPLLLLQQQHLEYPEAAAVLGITENALRVLVFRGRQMLREEMEAVR